ncbi:MAG: hypothetical protein COT74_08370 [Bdellovibrionales bacterium CG10_big_fil_rev_8_21_14_0_10_45_34]|nr:MAG: hypothetical protein COT74_08370 [Bdellovibrionales bacterium CG10_big_fil_rev_8_21_14_0_10_45_34]
MKFHKPNFNSVGNSAAHDFKVKVQESRKSSKDLPFDKYAFYTNAVQSPDTDVRFLRKVYRDFNKKDPRVLFEDFCGTFQICCEWVKLNAGFEAHGFDLDTEPLGYGTTHWFQKLKGHQKDRVQLHEQNVMDERPLKADVVCSLNFSYFIFKKRAELLSYFKRVRASLNQDGLFVIDLFGGSACFEANEEATKHSDFTYYWDQELFDPVANHAIFHIHFKPKGKKKFEKVFTYDWRMWSIPELKEILAEAGFKKSIVYWEGTDKKGEGDGVFKPVTVGEECQTWIAYIASS